MIHYLYTTFQQATKTGEPLMRPMWYEFPEQREFKELETQFMLGDSMLVAPKLTVPTTELEDQQQQQVTYTLPTNAKWYKEHTNTIEWVTGTPVTKTLSDIEQAVFIKGGSILPTLLHANCTALTKCVNGGIRLEVYLDDGMKASGKFYTDDGISFKHETHGEFALVSFEYTNNSIKGKLDSDPRKYGWPKTQVIEEVYVYGMNGASPSSIWQGGK